MADTDNTPNIIIADAMESCGMLAEGDSPTTDQLSRYVRRLRDIIRLEQTQGLKLFLNVNTSIPLTANKAAYTLGSGGDVSFTDNPKRIISAYYLSSDNVHRPLVPLSWDDYNRLSQTTQTGSVNSYFVDKQAYMMTVKFWLVPDAQAATGTVVALTQVAATGPVVLTDNTCFPQEWRMFLVWELANQICTGQPQSIIEKCAANAERYRVMLQDWDVEDANTQFQPDSRLMYGNRSFR